jgi:hypothetical protein
MNKQSTIKINDEATSRFAEVAEGILKEIGSFGPIDSRPARHTEIHPIAHFTSDDIIGEISVQHHSVNGYGEETGRFWNSNGLRVGWQGEEFAAIKDLVSKFEQNGSLKGRVSKKFLLNEIFKWLRETLERSRSDNLADYISDRCSMEFKDYEIWIPIYRTYSADEFSIGDVRFRSITKAHLDRLYSAIPVEELSNPEVAMAINRERSAIQGNLAACVRVHAEYEKAREIAQTKANEAVSFLRFISEVNWTSRIVSHCLPVGQERTMETLEVFIENNEIRQINKASIELGPAGWNVDEARHNILTVGLLEALHRLASQRNTNRFTADLFGALQLYARHSVSTEVSHKVVFVVAAIESLLLKNGQEPIQKNLGERMAFLIGKTVPERKDIIKTVDSFYKIRSGLIHHGRDIKEEDRETVDMFFFNVCFSLARLIEQVDQFRTRDDLIAFLEHRKLS